jgi:hypothetical protein
MLYLFFSFFPSFTIGQLTPHQNKISVVKAQLIILFLLFFQAFCFTAWGQNPLPPIGLWREHLNYQNTIQVLKGDRVYCATTTNLFSIDANNEVERYSKLTGLNDIGVQCIGWDAATQQLLIAYNNSNLDIMKEGIVKNIGDIKKSTITGNKTVYQIYCKDGLAYLSSGLGIIVVNLAKYEIKDTWFIGNNGSQVKINAFTSDNSFFYAATEEGVKSISVTAPARSNYTNWQNLSGANGIGNGPIQNIAFTNTKIIAQKNDSLLILNGNKWTFLYGDAAWPIINITASENKLLICQRTITGNARVIALNTNGIIERRVSQSGVISLPRSAIAVNGAIWIADQFGGLSRFTSGVERFIPNGPPGTADGDIAILNNALYAAAGSVNSAWNYLYNRNGVFEYKKDTWDSKSYYNTPALDSVLDFITLAIDPVDAGLWAGSYGGGLVNFKEGKQPFIYKKSNSTLQPAIGDPTNYGSGQMPTRLPGNLWDPR